MNNIAFSQTMSELHAEKIINLVENMEKVDKISDLSKLLTINY